MDEQRRVAEFIETHDMETSPEFRLLDFVSEVGELAKDVTESSGYGSAPAEIGVHEDEVGDALFSLLAFAEELDVDAGEALDAALAKYEGRIEETGDASSGE